MIPTFPNSSLHYKSHSHRSKTPLHRPRSLSTKTKLDKPGDISFSIRPPTQRTRDAVVNRLIETLSTPSVLSKRYGTIPPDEASSVARIIDDEAFTTASGSSSSDDDDIEILQVIYSKEISKRMLDTVKARATSASSLNNVATQYSTPDVRPSPAVKAASVADSESGMPIIV
ncbi:MFP1 attachment factor 1-like [Senna tora]|uniref:MFP1 attachment factor 1-like n=1 Tax=Senna tora TaxID=362788 RepID=A0A834W2T9_9FABA|nr:MFP1 attachment factor 1-like [Senna tora]